MMTVAQLAGALEALIAADPFFPTPSLDAPEAANLRTAIPGEAGPMADHCMIESPEELEVTRDGGAADSWELQGEFLVSYLANSVDVRGRRRRREAAKEEIVALIRENRDLGTGDAEVYAEIAYGRRQDEILAKGAPGSSLITIAIAVQFVAESAAG